jgi:hypothetical protein
VENVHVNPLRAASSLALNKIHTCRIHCMVLYVNPIGMLYSSTWKQLFYGIFGILYKRLLLGEVEPHCAVPKAFSKVKE